MKNLFVCLIALSSMFLGGCATIVGDKTSVVPLSSTPSEASILITDENGVQVFKGMTPTSVTLQKSDGSYWGKKNFTVEISKDGYEKQVIPITAHANGWYIAGNFIFGGLIGWFIVDPFNGAMYTLSPEQITSTLGEKVVQNNGSADGSISIVSLQDVPPSPSANERYAENSKLYLIGEIGSATYANMYPFPNPNKIGLGIGFNIDKYLSAELVYTKFGESTFTSPSGPINLNASSVVPSLVGILPVSQKFNLFGKLGYAINKANTNVAFFNFYNATSISNNAIYYGVGAQYNVNSQVALRFQYESFGKFENASPAMTPTAFTAGIIFNF